MKCDKFGTLYIKYDVKNDFVGIYRCCYNKYNPFKTYSLDEFSQIDIYSELLKYVNVYRVEDSQESGCKSFITEPACYTSKKYEKPLGVEVSLDFFCNIKCRWCGERLETPFLSFEKKSQLHKIYMATLYKLKGHKLGYLRLTDVGEPLFFKDDISSFIKSCTLDDFNEVYITTNGVNLSGTIVDAIKESPLNFRISVSLNAGSRNQYTQVTGTDNFDTVINNIINLKKISETHPNINIFITNIYDSEEDKNIILPFVEMLKEDFHIGYGMHEAIL